MAIPSNQSIESGRITIKEPSFKLSNHVTDSGLYCPNASDYGKSGFGYGAGLLDGSNQSFVYGSKPVLYY